MNFNRLQCYTVLQPEVKLHIFFYCLGDYEGMKLLVAMSGSHAGSKTPFSPRSLFIFFIVGRKLLADLEPKQRRRRRQQTGMF